MFPQIWGQNRKIHVVRRGLRVRCNVFWLHNRSSVFHFHSITQFSIHWRCPRIPHPTPTTLFNIAILQELLEKFALAIAFLAMPTSIVCFFDDIATVPCFRFSPRCAEDKIGKMVTLQYNAPSTSFDVFYLCLPWNVFCYVTAACSLFAWIPNILHPRCPRIFHPTTSPPTTSIDVVMLAVFLEKFALNDIATLPYSRFFPQLWEKITPRIFKFKNCFELSR